MYFPFDVYLELIIMSKLSLIVSETFFLVIENKIDFN